MIVASFFAFTGWVYTCIGAHVAAESQNERLRLTLGFSHCGIHL